MDHAHDRPEPPASVGPYRIANRIGGGGMGEVYRAYDQRLERWVAVKHLKADIAAKKAQRARFRREARSVASLNHPAIVQIFDILEDSAWGDWIVMELVEGKTLKEVLVGGPLEIRKVIQLAFQIVEGLAVAHERGIVHRDLKAENVMVVSPKRDRVKILDFGLAKDCDRTTDSSISGAGIMLGTSRAMSPEQVMGHEVDPRSDLFSLGILLFEAITGESPFRGSNSVLTLARVCNHVQPPVREICPETPEALADLIDQLLEKDKNLRPQTAEEVMSVLKSLEEGYSSSSSDGVAPLPSRMSPGPAISVGNSQSGFFVKTLVRLLIDGHDGLIENHGEVRGYGILSQIDRLTRDLLGEYRGLEIHKTDNFLLLFERPIDAVDFLLMYQNRLRRLGHEVGVPLRSRSAIHVGEIFVHENAEQDVALGAQLFEVEGRSKQTTARVLALVHPSQILMTREAFELSKRAFEDDVDAGQRVSRAEMHWESHGEYFLPGGDPPVSIFEVGRKGRAPFLPPRLLTPQRRWRPIFALGFLLVVLGVAVFGWFVGGEFFGGESRTRISVAVLGFKNLSGNSDFDWHSTAISELLATDLAASDSLRTIPGESIARMKRDLDLGDLQSFSPDTLLAIGRQLGADHVVVGSYLVLGEDGDKHISFQPILQDVRTSEIVAAIQIEGSELQMLDLVSRTGRQLRSYLGAFDPNPIESKALRSTLPARPAAARPYSEGLAKLRAYDALEARVQLEESIKIDGEFALAHAALSEAWAQLGYAEKAIESAERAVSLARELPRREELQIEGRSYEVSKQWNEAIKIYEALWKFYDDDLEYGLRLARAHTEAGEPLVALAVLKELRGLAYPLGSDPRIDMTEARITQDMGEYPAMLEAARRAERKGRAWRARVLMGDALQSQAWAQRQLGRQAQAVTSFKEALRLYRQTSLLANEAQVLNGLAILRQDTGDLAGAEEMFSQSLDIHQRTGNEWWQANLLGNLGFLQEWRGELIKSEALGDEAARLFGKVGDQREQQIQQEYAVRVLLSQDRLEDARRLVEAFRTSPTRFGRDHQVWRDIMEAELLLAEGAPGLALGVLEKTEGLWEEVRDQSILGEIHLTLGKVQLALGNLSDAGLALERSRSIHQESGHRLPLAWTELTRAELLLERGEWVVAEELASEARQIFFVSRCPDAAASAELVLVRAALAVGEFDKAERLLKQAAIQARVTERPALRRATAVARQLVADSRR